MPQRALLPRGVDPQDSSNITMPARNEAKRDPSPSSNPVTRKRGPLVSAACNSCRKRKVKCDGNRPHCSNCHKRSIPCIYDKTLKAERLKLVQERVKDALSELDQMKGFLSVLAGNVTNNENGEAVAQAMADLDRLRSTFDDIETEMPWRGPQTGAQSSLGAITLEDDDDEEESAPSTPWSAQSSRSNFPSQRKVSISFSTLDQQIPMSGSSSRLDTQLFGSQSAVAAASGGLLQIHFEGESTRQYAHPHHMLPLISYEFDEHSKSCSLYQLNCRKLLAEGIAPENVLGSETLDLNRMFGNETMIPGHSLTDWVLSYVNAFPGWPNLDLAFKIATVWSIFKVFRWLIHPTLTNYEGIPEFMRPTPVQLFTPHAFWIALIARPETRNEFILRPRDDHHQQWMYMQSNARINWPSTDPKSMITLHPQTGAFHFIPDFEYTINRIENWLFLG